MSNLTFYKRTIIMQHLNLNLYMILFIIIAAVVLLAVIVYALYRIRHTRRPDAMDEMEGL